jgi:hypothetical protein
MACPHCGSKGTVYRSKSTGRRRCSACGEVWFPTATPTSELVRVESPRTFYPRLLSSAAALEAYCAQLPAPVALAAGILADDLWKTINGTDAIWQPDKVASALLTSWSANQHELVIACRCALDRIGVDSNYHQQFIAQFGESVVTAGVNAAILATHEARKKAITSGLLKVGAVALGAVFGAWWS